MQPFHPFKKQHSANNSSGKKEQLRDPLDVSSLLTENHHKAVITPEGELKLQENDQGEKPSVELMKERYWGSKHQKLFQERLAYEARVIKEKFPHFQLQQSTKNLRFNRWCVARKGEFFWLGHLTTYSQNRYQVAIVYPKDYPFGEIRAYVLQPYIPATEHRFKQGHLCLYDHDGNGAKFDQNTTAITVIAWTAAWLHAYEIWRETGTWPTLEENLP